MLITNILESCIVEHYMWVHVNTLMHDSPHVSFDFFTIPVHAWGILRGVKLTTVQV